MKLRQPPGAWSGIGNKRAFLHAKTIRCQKCDKTFHLKAAITCALPLSALPLIVILIGSLILLGHVDGVSVLGDLLPEFFKGFVLLGLIVVYIFNGGEDVVIFDDMAGGGVENFL